MLIVDTHFRLSLWATENYVVVQSFECQSFAGRGLFKPYVWIEGDKGRVEERRE